MGGSGQQRVDSFEQRARWAPRVPATACTSSTITVSTPRSESRACDVRIRNNDSGVVMSTSGGVRWNLRRSSSRRVARTDADCDVGLKAARGDGRLGRFRRAGHAGCARCRRPGPSMAETYGTRQRSFGSAGFGSAVSRSSAHRNAAGLARPGGRDDQRVVAIGHGTPGTFLGGRGSGEPAPANRALVACPNTSRTSVTYPSSPVPPTTRLRLGHQVRICSRSPAAEVQPR